MLFAADMRLLRRLVMNPGMRQSDLAKDLHVSRPMVNQTWQKLAHDNGLRVKSNIDYGQVGMSLVFGWAQASETSDRLRDFYTWLESNVHTAEVTESVMSSRSNAAVYFEVIIPPSDTPPFPSRFMEWSSDTSSDFAIKYDLAREVSNHLNMGLFDGGQWTLDEGFRFEASTGAVKDYADVLPTMSSLKLSKPVTATIDNMAILSVLEDNYHASVGEVTKYMSHLGLQSVPERTLRRRIDIIRRRMTLPYVTLSNIGLTDRFFLCIDSGTQESTLSRALHIQASTLPKARVLSGRSLSVLSIELPSLRNWLALTSSLMQITKSPAETLTFIAQESATKNTLEQAIQGVTRKHGHA